jgi:hypothetical protein
LFWPDARTAWRQWACDKPLCQSKRRQQTQQRYRENNRGEQQARQYREAMAEAKEGSAHQLSIPKTGPIFGSLLWQEIKDELQPQLLVTIVFFAKLLFLSARDEIRAQGAVITKEMGNYQDAETKDEIEPKGASA